MSKKWSKQTASSLEQEKQKQKQKQRQKQKERQKHQDGAENTDTNLKNQSQNLTCDRFGAKLDQVAAKRRPVVATTQTPLVKAGSRARGFNQRRSRMQRQKSQPELLTEQANQDQHHNNNESVANKQLTTSKESREREREREQFQQLQRQHQQANQQREQQKQKQCDNICAACLKPIRERYLLVALDKQWHEDCLKCACCDCRLGEVGSSLFTHADKILCRRDFLRIFGQAGNCAACNKSIPPYELVMRANENAYHMECFACQQCQYRFCVGDKFHLNDAHRIICILCHTEQQQQQHHFQHDQQQQQQQPHSTSYHTSDIQLAGAGCIAEQALHFGGSNSEASSTLAASPKQASQLEHQSQEKEDSLQHSSSSPQQQQQKIKLQQPQQQPAAAAATTCAM